MNNAYYNVYHLGNQKTHRVRCGGIYKDGVQLFGGDIDVTTRKFWDRKSHFWVETKDGEYVIDWVLCEELDDEKVKVYKKSDIEALGYSYKYYTHEKGIERKARRTFGGCGECDRRIFGEWPGSQRKKILEAERKKKENTEKYLAFIKEHEDDPDLTRKSGYKYMDDLPVYLYKGEEIRRTF